MLEGMLTAGQRLEMPLAGDKVSEKSWDLRQDN
jgi:hypothetical protein